jgi:thermolysin
VHRLFSEYGRVRCGSGGILPLGAGLTALAAPLARSPRAPGRGQGPELRAWDAQIERLTASGDLRLLRTQDDLLLPGRRHERYTQLYRGVPIFGGEVVRQSDAAGAISVFGTYHPDVQVDVRPTLSASQAAAIVARVGQVRPGSEPELLVFPKSDGGYALTWRLKAYVPGETRYVYFVDAHDGSIVNRYGELETQSAVGLGRGVLNDEKKVSAEQSGGTFTANDQLRPPAILTYDLGGNFDRSYQLFFLGIGSLSSADLARDSDNNWTDGAAVDAHTYAGWVYDYYFKRYGRHGLDNRDLPIRSIVHPVKREDVFTVPEDVIGVLYVNAFWDPDSLYMVYGEGLSSNLRLDGQAWNYLAGALDVVAHELTHGVTQFSSNLIYQGEPGALNESFSDMMGTGCELYYQAAGSGPLLGDFLIGEDVVTPGGLRSMQSPASFGDPDHYSIRFTGPEDNGGVHINSGIPNNAFYLAIQGGTNRVSGQAVTGVGLANREQVEKAFYRAFTQMLPASANFSAARAATIQSARDLYGAGSAAERAITQAWSAVGVS